jgi:hypothetical protein
MKRIVIILTSIAIVGASVAFDNAHADNGQIAAGILGGLAAGTILGAATAPRPYYYAPVYVEPAPVYVEPHCYWTSGEPVWDGWRQAWVRSRVRFCD